MREILFRGKDSETGEWVFGWLMIGLSGRVYIVYAVDDVAIWKITPRPMFVEVDPATVGQYTGLTDKNGKRIFEGDIVKYGADYERKNIVVFEQGCFQLQGNGGLAPLRYHNLISSYVLEGYVIGTIHDKEGAE